MRQTTLDCTVLPEYRRHLEVVATIFIHTTFDCTVLPEYPGHLEVVAIIFIHTLL